MFQIGSMDRLCSCIIAICYGIISTLDVFIKLLNDVVNILSYEKKEKKNNSVLLYYRIKKKSSCY